MRILPARLRQLRDIDPNEAAIRAVERLLAYFIFDGRTYGIETLLIDTQPTHSVSFRPKNQIERVRRDRHVVFRKIVKRPRAEPSSRGGDELEEFARPQLRRALEHEVLKEMSKTGATARLASRAGGVIDADARQRHARVG